MKKIVSLLLSAGIMAGALFSGAGTTFADDVPFRQKDNVISVFDEKGGFYKGIAPGTTAADFLAEFDTAVSLKDSKGNDVKADKPVGTDYTVNSGNDSRRVVVYGDVNRDAKLNLADVTVMLKSIALWDTDMSKDAADVTLDGRVNLSDASIVLKAIAKWDVECGFVSWKYDLSKVDAPNEDSGLEMFFVHSAVRKNYDVLKPNGLYSYDMYMAKNEYEGCHVNLYSEAGHTGLSASVTDFRDKAGNTLETELFFEDYFVAKTGEAYPDRLPPIEVKNGFSVKAGTTQGMFIKVKTDFDTVPGMYRARVDVKDEAGSVIKRAYVYTYVWDFEVPEEPSVQSAFGMGSYSIYAAHNIGEDPEKDLYISYYEYFLENRLTTWCLPFKPTDDRADKYMSDPRVTSFLVYGGYGGDMYGNEENPGAYIDEAYAKIKGNEEWEKKAFFYVDDEPRFGNQLMSIVNNKTFIDAHYPDARIVVPMHVNYFETGDWSDVNTGFDNGNEYPLFDGLDTYAILDKYTTLMCPSVRLFTTSDMEFKGEVWYTEQAINTFGTLRSRLEKSREAGKDIWWYYAGDDNISFIRDGMTVRTAFWQQYDYDIEGVLCWAVSEWQNISPRPQSQREIDGAAGIYVYSGRIYGITGPVACLRTEIMRDGLEDFEYLVLAEKLFGKEVADEYNHRITTDMVTFERDAEVLESVRRELGAKIAEAMAEK